MKAILVGNGRFGSVYRERLSDHQRFEVVGIVEPRRENIPHGNWMVSATLEKMLPSVEADCVVIASPPITHADYAIQALNAGKDVFCAKPGGVTPSDARMIRRAAERNHRAFFVDYTMQSAPEANFIFGQLGAIGEVTRFSSVRRVVTGPRPETIILDLACHDLAAFWEFYDTSMIMKVGAHRPDHNGIIIDLFDEDDVLVGTIRCSYDADRPTRSIFLRLRANNEMVDERYSITWNQHWRDVHVASKKEGMSFNFRDNPDPITLALSRFYSMSRYRLSGRMFANIFDQHKWVHDITSAAHESLHMGGTPMVTSDFA